MATEQWVLPAVLGILGVTVFAGCGANGPVNGQGAGAPPALRGEALASASPRAEVRSDPGAPAEDALEEAGAGVAEARGGATPEGVADAAVLDRGRFVAAVLARNPSVSAARQAWRAAKSRRVQREALDDPMLSYSFAPLSIGSGMRYGQTVELSQRFPWPGKLGSLGDAAEAEADEAAERYQAVKLDLALAASMLYDDYYLVARSLDINREHQSLLEQLQQSAQARYGVGRGSLQDPLQAEVERVRLVHDAIVLEADRAVTVARMNALLHRPSNAELPPPPVELAISTEAPAAPAVLHERALGQRSELRAFAARVRALEARRRFAEREYYPDFTLMLSYSSMWESIEHQFMVGVAAPIPIQRGARGGAREEASALGAEARQELKAQALEIQRDVDVARARVVEALQIVELYEGKLLPLARDRLRAALAGFEADANDFSAVITAENRLRQDQLGYHAAKADLSKRQAELARATGEAPALGGEGAR